ncbi:MAG: alpha/beta hydrolase [Deltaproteobacteria bacterium]|nr:alpha/beta hydrolase [Deltaproteobacteria bacterium]
MAESTQGWREETVRVAGTDLTLIQGGTGRPLLVLHEELGFPGWLRWNSELARSHTLVIPHHPGFGKSPRVEWVRGIRDLAGFYARVLRERGLAPADVIGFSLGGWIAAEMAACDARQFRRMVLVAPTGIKPPVGDIMDTFVVTARAYLDASAHDIAQTPEFAKLFGGEQTPEQYEAWEDARAETARLAWQPYMFNPSLGPLLEGVVDLPTLLIWGKEDKIVPASAAEVYRKSIAGSQLVMFDGCGHRPEIEKAQEFIDRVQSFLA